MAELLTWGIMNDCRDTEFRRGRLAADDIVALKALKATKGTLRSSDRACLCAALGDADLMIRLQLAGLKSTVIVLFEARMRASSLDSTAVAVTPSGETVTTK